MANEDVIVTVNGVQCATRLYNGVQRFVPDPAVKAMVEAMVNSFDSRSQTANALYGQIPAELKTLDHDNAVVNYAVKMNEDSYFGLNEIVLALHDGLISVHDYIFFNTLHGYSVDGFCDAVESQLSNLDLGETYEDKDGDEYEDYSAYFTIENPRWAD